MKIIQIPLANQNYHTPATLTGYLQTPVPKSPVQQFRPLLFVPGGSLTHIPVEESEKTALHFAALGFQVFILRYTFIGDQTPAYPQPIIDTAQAVATIKQHATDWYLKSNEMTLMGFSAGGQIVALYNDYWDSQWLQSASNLDLELLKPRAVILGYPVIDFALGFPKDPAITAQWTNDPQRFSASKHVTKSNAPTFIWATMDDPVVPVQNAIAYSTALLNHKIPQELHLFAHGPHGMDIANPLVAHHPDGAQSHVARWTKMAAEWLDDLFNN